jgi:hypothetical protein
MTRPLPDRALPCPSVRFTNHYGLEIEAKSQFTGGWPFHRNGEGEGSCPYISAETPLRNTGSDPAWPAARLPSTVMAHAGGVPVD